MAVWDALRTEARQAAEDAYLQAAVIAKTIRDPADLSREGRALVADIARRLERMATT